MFYNIGNYVALMVDRGHEGMRKVCINMCPV